MESCQYVLESRKYKKDEFIGSGSFGRVFVVEKDGKKYVMKIITLDSFVNAINSVPRFLNEVKISKVVSDNGLGPKLIDWWMCEPGPKLKNGVIISEKLDVTLFRYLRNGYIPKYEKICVVVKCLNKLKKLHTLGICHGDLTRHLGNVMLDEKQEPYFIDFGSSTAMVDKPDDVYWCYFFEMKNFLSAIAVIKIFGKIFNDKFNYDFPKEKDIFNRIEKGLSFPKVLQYEEEFYNNTIKFIEDNLEEIVQQ